MAWPVCGGVLRGSLSALPLHLLQTGPPPPFPPIHPQYNTSPTSSSLARRTCTPPGACGIEAAIGSAGPSTTGLPRSLGPSPHSLWSRGSQPYRMTTGLGRLLLRSSHRHSSTLSALRTGAWSCEHVDCSARINPNIHRRGVSSGLTNANAAARAKGKAARTAMLGAGWRAMLGATVRYGSEM